MKYQGPQHEAGCQGLGVRHHQERTEDQRPPCLASLLRLLPAAHHISSSVPSSGPALPVCIRRITKTFSFRTPRPPNPAPWPAAAAVSPHKQPWLSGTGNGGRTGGRSGGGGHTSKLPPTLAVAPSPPGCHSSKDGWWVGGGPLAWVVWERSSQPASQRCTRHHPILALEELAPGASPGGTPQVGGVTFVLCLCIPSESCTFRHTQSLVHAHHQPEVAAKRPPLPARDDLGMVGRGNGRTTKHAPDRGPPSPPPRRHTHRVALFCLDGPWHGMDGGRRALSGSHQLPGRPPAWRPRSPVWASCLPVSACVEAWGRGGEGGSGSGGALV